METNQAPSSPNINSDTLKAFHLMWDSFPSPAVLLRKDRTVLACNPAALKIGYRLGARCFQTFGDKAVHNTARQMRHCATAQRSAPWFTIRPRKQWVTVTGFRLREKRTCLCTPSSTSLHTPSPSSSKSSPPAESNGGTRPTALGFDLCSLDLRCTLIEAPSGHSCRISCSLPMPSTAPRCSRVSPEANPRSPHQFPPRCNR